MPSKQNRRHVFNHVMERSVGTIVRADFSIVVVDDRVRAGVLTYRLVDERVGAQVLSECLGSSGCHNLLLVYHRWGTR